MKKMIVCLTLAAFVCVPSLQAGEKKAQAASTKSEASCTAKAETSCSAKTACCATAKTAAKRGLKGGALLALR